MCFSAEASFSTSALLLPVGAWCWHMARKRVPEFSAFAILPVAFGLQQLAEGFVWVGLDAVGTTWLLPVRPYSCFSPSCFGQFGFRLPQPSQNRLGSDERWLVHGWWSVWPGLGFISFPCLATTRRAVTACVCERSIQYWYSDSQLLATNAWHAVAVYLLCTLCPLAMMSCWRRMIVPIALVIVSVVITILAFRSSFTSVWCFFAAFISLYTAWFLYHEANAREAITHHSDAARIRLIEANRSLG